MIRSSQKSLPPTSARLRPGPATLYGPDEPEDAGQRKEEEARATALLCAEHDQVSTSPLSPRGEGFGVFCTLPRAHVVKRQTRGSSPTRTRTNARRQTAPNT